MQADGSDPHNLTQRANANDYRPVWSPDGRQIAFDSWDDTGNRDIYLMDADGGHLYNLTQDPGRIWVRAGRRMADRSLFCLPAMVLQESMSSIPMEPICAA